ncbi:DUF86 domain-containing protein [Brevibacterium casei]|nr:DUF86 domain-containing protein [Brevibacterium casei]
MPAKRSMPSAVLSMASMKASSRTVCSSGLRSSGLEVLGEALNRVRSADPETAALIADIHRIIAMRNVIAHQYGEIDYAIVWSAVNDRVPRLRSTIAALLSD